MGQEHEVSSIVIHNRLDCCRQQNGYALVELYNNNDEVVHSYSLGNTNGVASHTFDASMSTMHPFTTNAELRTAIQEYLGQNCTTNVTCQALTDYGGAVSPLLCSSVA